MAPSPPRLAGTSSRRLRAFKVLFLLCTGLRPRGKQEHISEPRLTPALGFSHGPLAEGSVLGTQKLARKGHVREARRPREASLCPNLPPDTHEVSLLSGWVSIATMGFFSLHPPPDSCSDPSNPYSPTGY